MTAISHALNVQGYFELPEEQRPPEEIWLDDELLGDHFERVKDHMKAKSSGGAEEWQDIPSEQNELTAGIRRR